MEGQIKGLILGVVGVLVLAILINVAISIYEPTAVKNAIKATTSYNQTVDGIEYQFDGNGQSAQDAGQEAHDNINVIRTTANVLLGIVFLVLVILSAVSLFKGGKRG